MYNNTLKGFRYQFAREKWYLWITNRTIQFRLRRFWYTFMKLKFYFISLLESGRIFNGKLGNCRKLSYSLLQNVISINALLRNVVYKSFSVLCQYMSYYLLIVNFGMHMTYLRMAFDIMSTKDVFGKMNFILLLQPKVVFK